MLSANCCFDLCGCFSIQHDVHDQLITAHTKHKKHKQIDKNKMAKIWMLEEWKQWSNIMWSESVEAPVEGIQVKQSRSFKHQTNEYADHECGKHKPHSKKINWINSL